MTKNQASIRREAKDNGGARGGTALLELNQMPRNALRSKACGERSEDFCAPKGHERNGIFAGCRKSPRTFSTACSSGRAGAYRVLVVLLHFPLMAFAYCLGETPLISLNALEK